MSTNSSTTDPATVDMAAVRQLVDRAVRAAVPAAQMTTRKIRPESDYGFPEPRPLAGLQAALAVTRLAQDQAYTFAKGLRGEGSSWDEIADLLEIEWSEDYARRERAFELVAGPASTISYDRYVFFTCGGPAAAASASPTGVRTSATRPTTRTATPRVAGGWPPRSRRTGGSRTSGSAATR
ncbi:hypothetical protein GCM10029963_79330 [Micromonospora andamanensis]